MQNDANSIQTKKIDEWREKRKIETKIGNQIPGQMKGDLEQTNRLTYCEKREKSEKLAAANKNTNKKKINCICERCIWIVERILKY